MSRFHIIIPARFASTRLPGKPLLPILGKPMIEHVWGQVSDCGADSVIVATDHADIASTATGFGADVAHTRVDHNSGSERAAEVCAQQGWADDDIVVNVQGDEPLMPAALVPQVAGLLDEQKDASCASLFIGIQSAEEVRDPNIVKVVVSEQRQALYFSRSAIPFDRDAQQGLAIDQGFYRHIGIYAYRVAELRWFVNTAPSVLEQREKLEQLRFLSHGRKIAMAEATHRPGPGVDTEQDLLAVERVLAKL